MKLQGLDHVAINVRDIARSKEWYARVLGLESRDLGWGDAPPQMMFASESCVALFTPTVSNPADFTEEERWEQIGMTHFAFRVDRANYVAAQEKFRSLDIEFREADHGACWSLYIHDPDGHTVEVTTYEIS